MSKGFLTLDGPKPEYAELYGVAEHTSFRYPPRAYVNVKNADVTLRIASDFDSAGERCTLKAIHQYKRPHLDIDLHDLKPIEEVIEWTKDFEVLNVAGNSEKTFLGIGNVATKYLTMVFHNLRSPG